MELTKELLAEWISRFSEKIQNNKGYLSDLDAAIGDGDHGNNMARGMQAVTESLEKNETADTTQSLKLIAMALISKVGGASGPLYGTAFLEMVKASNDTKDLGELLQKRFRASKSAAEHSQTTRRWLTFGTKSFQRLMTHL